MALSFKTLKNAFAAKNTTSDTAPELAPPDAEAGEETRLEADFVAPEAGEVEVAGADEATDGATFDELYGDLEPFDPTVEASSCDGAPEVESAGLAEGELAEWSEPLPDVPAPPPLAVGAVLEMPAGGALQIVEMAGTQSQTNIYQAVLLESAQASSCQEQEPVATIRLREAMGTAAQRLAREAQAREAANTPLIPRAVAWFEVEDRGYYAQELLPEAPSLATLLEADNSLPEVLHALVQAAAAMARLHAGGWAHLGLRPEIVLLGKPVMIAEFGSAVPLGQALHAPISHAGYSAPELAIPGAVAQASSDIYALGAILYHAVTGSSVPETGVDLSTWQPRHVVAGVPQLLRRCLGEPDSRYRTVEELHRDLVRLKNRLKPLISYSLAAASTIGLEPTRVTNQDAFVTLGGVAQSESGALPWALLCVADGMGGMAAGEVASEVAVQSMQSSVTAASAALCAATPPSAAEQVQWLKDWTAAANEKVCQAMSARNARGGCTLASALVVERRLTIAHVGDCRVYLLRGESWQALSRDHSFVMSLVLQNEVAVEDIRSHPDRNKVTRSLGDRHPLPDYFADSLEVATGCATLELQAGDTILIGSDGLWEPVLEGEMLAAVRNADLPEAAQRLLDLALQRGAPDNATVALLRLNEHAPSDVQRAAGPILEEKISASDSEEEAINALAQ